MLQCKFGSFITYIFWNMLFWSVGKRRAAIYNFFDHNVQTWFVLEIHKHFNFGKFSKSYKPCIIKVQSAKYGIENCNLSRHFFCNKIMTCRTKNINRLFGASHLQSFTCYCFTFCWFNDTVYDFGNFALTHTFNSYS